jgi:cytochrome c553
VFNTNCAICHGAEAAGTPDWRKPMEDGKYPAPPLNGTAHGWHHPLKALRRQINQGGAKYGGWMPAVGDSLTDEQVDEAIAYIQSLWPDKIYAAWLKNDAAQSGDSPATVPTAKKTERNNILRHLSSRLPNSKFGEPEETPLKGIFRLSMDDSIIYVSSDGRYVFLGDMVDLKEGRNFSKKGLP